MADCPHPFNAAIRQEASLPSDVMVAGCRPATSLFLFAAGLLKGARRTWPALVFLLCSCGQTGDLYLPGADARHDKTQKTAGAVSVSDAAY